MKKKILAVVLGLTLCLGMTGCASWDRMVTDMKSDVNGGMQRTITVYTADGKELATYEGKIDIDTNDGGYVKFDFNGKRYVYYNCFVESIADIDQDYSLLQGCSIQIDNGINVNTSWWFMCQWGCTRFEPFIWCKWA